MEDIKSIFKWPVSVVIAVVFTITAAVYFFSTQNLVKPATTQEAVSFLFKYPGEYFLALFMGGIAKVTTVVMFIMALGVTFRFITNDFWEYSRGFSVGYLIINWLVTIVIAVIQKYIVAYFWVLLGVIVVIAILVYVWLNSDRRY